MKSDHRRPVLVDEGLPRAPDQELRHAGNIAVDEERLCNRPQLRIEGEGRHHRHEVDLLFRQHRAHGRQRCFQHDIVALVLEAVLSQHATDRDIDRSARRDGADDLALQVLDLFDRAVGHHHVFLRIMARHAVLQFVGDDAQVAEAGIQDRDRQCREGEACDFKLVVGERRDHQRRADIADRLEHIGLAHVAREFLLLEEERCPVRHRRDPRDADLDRLLRGRGGGPNQQDRGECRRQQAQCPHGRTPLDHEPGLAPGHATLLTHRFASAALQSFFSDD